MIRTLLGAAAVAVSLSAAALALPITGTTSDTLDPTVLHITGSGAIGSDPVVINQTSSFITLNVSGQSIPQPIDLFFAVYQPGGTVPSISGVTDGLGNAVSFTGVTNTGVTMVSGQDLYTQLGCVPCDNSLSFTNFVGSASGNPFGLANLIPPITGVTSFNLYEAVIMGGLSAGASDTISGNFPVGTFIAPFAMDSQHVYDTSYTNTGLIGNAPPHGPPVPEPGSLAMLLTALLSLGGLTFYYRKS